MSTLEKFEELYEDIYPRLANSIYQAFFDKSWLAEVEQEISKAFASEDAQEYARDHAGDLIQDIDNSQLQAIRDIVMDGVHYGWGPNQVAQEIENETGLTWARSQRIASYETAAAINHGQLQSWKDDRGKKLIPPDACKQWVLHPSERTCSHCLGMDKTIVPLGGGFGNLDCPPAHPDCRCTIKLVSPLGFAINPQTEIAKAEQGYDSYVGHPFWGNQYQRMEGEKQWEKAGEARWKENEWTRSHDIMNDLSTWRAHLAGPDHNFDPDDLKTMRRAELIKVHLEDHDKYQDQMSHSHGPKVSESEELGRNGRKQDSKTGKDIFPDNNGGWKDILGHTHDDEGNPYSPKSIIPKTKLRRSPVVTTTLAAIRNSVQRYKPNGDPSGRRSWIDGAVETFHQLPNDSYKEHYIRPKDGKKVFRWKNDNPERIAAGVPASWHNVWLNDNWDKNPDLIMHGYAEDGRKLVPVYSRAHNKIRDEKTIARHQDLIGVGSETSPYDTFLDKTVEQYPNNDAAAANLIMDRMGLRPSAEVDAVNAQGKVTYGVTTLLTDHVTHLDPKTNRVELTFVPGKSGGKEKTFVSNDPHVFKAINDRFQKRDWGERLFDHRDIINPATGKPFSSMYAATMWWYHNVGTIPKGVKLKDLRTSKVNQLWLALLEGYPRPQDWKQLLVMMEKLGTEVGSIVGHSWRVDITNYVNKHILAQFVTSVWGPPPQSKAGKINPLLSLVYEAWEDEQ